MFTREIQLKIIEQMKQIKPKSYQDVASWKQLDYNLSANIREIKECDYKFLRDYVVSDLLVEVLKQNKLNLPMEDVENLCYPFLISLLNLKVTITRSEKILVNIPVEKLQRQKAFLAYLLSEGKFNKDLWKKMHLLSIYYPQEYHNINLNDPRYELSSANIRTLNKLAVKEHKEKIPVVETSIKWHEKRIPLKLKRGAPENDDNDREIDLTYCSILHKEKTPSPPEQRDQVEPLAANSYNRESTPEVPATNTELSPQHLSESHQNTKVSSSLLPSYNSKSPREDLDPSKWLDCDRESDLLWFLTSQHRSEITSPHPPDEDHQDQLFRVYDFEKVKEKIASMDEEKLSVFYVSSDDSFDPSIIFNEDSNSECEDDI